MTEKTKKNRTQEINDYKRRAYKRVPLELKKENYDRIREKANITGETVNGFIKRIIAEHIGETSKIEGRKGDK